MEKKHNTLLTGAILGGTLGLLAARHLKESKKSNFLSAFAEEPESSIATPIALASAAALIGVGAGLLLAPKSGKQLRNDITDIIDNLQEKTTNFASSIGEQGGDFIHNFSEQASELVEKAKNMAGHVTNGVHKGRRHHRGEGLTDTLENAINMANVGVRLWNTLTKGR